MHLGGIAGRRAPAMTGTLAVVLLLAAARWGSYIGYSPLFLTDILVLLAVFHRWASASRLPRPFVAQGGRLSVSVAVVVFFAYVVVRSLLTPLVFTMDWARDVLPFLYSCLAFVSAGAYVRSSVQGRARTMRLLRWALNFHLCWTLLVTAGVVDPDGMPRLPGSDITVFTVRPDVDAAILGITAGLYLHRMITLRPRWRSLVGLVLSGFATTGFETRAGLIAVLVSLALSYGLTMLSTRVPGKRLALMVAAPLIAVAMFVPFSQTTAGGRLLATVGVEDADSDEQRNAVGTTNAREQAWSQVVGWTADDDMRLVFGSGFGNNFLEESGAAAALSGTDYTGVRSPHNWLVGVFARLGAVGVLAAGCVLLAAASQVLRLRRTLGGSEVALTATLGVVAFGQIAMLGVVLESPFGAVPFWWFLGILLAARQGNERMAHPRDLSREWAIRAAHT